MSGGWAQKRILFGIELTVAASAGFGYLVGRIVGSEDFLFGTILAFGGLCLFSAIAWKFANESRRQIDGVHGEIKVSATLARLPQQGYWFWNNVVLPDRKGDIDHVVVSAHGIWAVETKHWDAARVGVERGALRKDGYAIDGKLGQVTGNAGRLKEYLSDRGVPVPWVIPVLVFSRDATDVSVPEPYERVHVVGFRDLQARIIRTRQSRPLSPAAVAKAKKLIAELVQDE